MYCDCEIRVSTSGLELEFSPPQLNTVICKTRPGTGRTFRQRSCNHLFNYILDYFEKNNYFGADKDQIVIFEQRMIPAFDEQV